MEAKNGNIIQNVPCSDDRHSTSVYQRFGICVPDTRILTVVCGVGWHEPLYSVQLLLYYMELALCAEVTNFQPFHVEVDKYRNASATWTHVGVEHSEINEVKNKLKVEIQVMREVK